MRLINWELAKNPANWIIVFLMLAFFVLAMSLINPLKVGG